MSRATGRTLRHPPVPTQTGAPTTQGEFVAYWHSYLTPERAVANILVTGRPGPRGIRGASATWKRGREGERGNLCTGRTSSKQPILFGSRCLLASAEVDRSGDAATPGTASERRASGEFARESETGTQTVMARAVDAARERPKAALALAAFLICAGLVLGPIREAIAYTFDTDFDRRAYNFPRDSDGRVSESTGNLNGGGSPPYSNRKRVTFGKATPVFEVSHPSAVATYVSLKYDWVATDYCTVPRTYVTKHERAHSRGWAHFKETPAVNNAWHKNAPQGCNP